MLVVGAGVYYFIQSRKPVTTYTTENAVRGDLAQTVSETGNISPDLSVDLSFKTSGRLLYVNFDVGDYVKKGDRVAAVDSGLLSAQLREAEQNVKVQKELLNNMKERDDTYNSEQRDSQRATIKSAEAAVDAVRAQIYDTVMYAPIDGIVTKRYADTGETTALNSTVLTIVKEGDLELDVDVAESDITKVKIGQNATFTLDAYSSDAVFHAQVTEVEPASTVIQDVVYYKIKLKMADPDSGFKPGMSADVDIRTAEKNNVIMIPLRAIQEENGGKFVEILNPDGLSTSKVTVQTGLQGDEGMVEITSGLSEGQKVVTLTKTQ